MRDSSVTPRFQNPTQECDLIMKGGITSGIVYPPAILKLAETYRFRCIGGTSVGAIAAAAAAAAEFGRASGGFEKLQKVREQATDPEFIRRLFSPQSNTAPLLGFLNDIIRKKESLKNSGAPCLLLRLTWLAFKHDRARFLGGAVGVISASLVLAWLTGCSLLSGLLLGAAFAPLAGLLGVVAHVYRLLTREVPANYFGICNGRSDTKKEDPSVLTDWICRTLDSLAGLDPTGPPLTFGQLRKHSPDINLRIVTTNLSHHQPYELPFEKHLFAMKISDVENLFPHNISEYLTTWKPDDGKPHPTANLCLPRDYCFLPDADALPVAVAVRLSLSFPLLISAVPLYTISYDALRTTDKNQCVTISYQDLKQNWFSDGGISSNFPIHFFDAWLPDRPTFGITLTALPRDAFSATDSPEVDARFLSGGLDSPRAGMPRPADETKPVFLPKADQSVPTEWIPIEGMFPFIWAIFASAQNYRDTTQSMLPSYRDRIVQIRLSDDEGGLNLDMKPETIGNVMDRGTEAAGLLLKEFTLKKHQWVRFLVLMAEVERNLGEILGSWADINLHEILQDQLVSKAPESDVPKPGPQWAYPYHREREWVDRAVPLLEELKRLCEALGGTPFFVKDPPLPNPELRVTPHV